MFESASAQRGQTWPSLTTILTGKYPITHGVRKNGQNLRAEGFLTGAFLTNMLQADHRGFATLRKVKEGGNHAAKDALATAQAVAWLEEHGEERFVLWLHLMGPHKPYALPEEFPEMFRIESEELYDLERDPTEQQNLIEEQPDMAARLRDKLLLWIETKTQTAGTADLSDEETLRQLEALGYTR